MGVQSGADTTVWGVQSGPCGGRERTVWGVVSGADTTTVRVSRADATVQHARGFAISRMSRADTTEQGGFAT